MVTAVLVSFIAIAEAHEGTDANSDIIWIGLAHESEAEAVVASQLRALIRKYELVPWIRTRRILIDEDQIPHSHPVLTIGTGNIDDEPGLLAAFIHEQLHWLEEEPWIADFRATMEEFGKLFPDVPSSAEGGARDDTSTYRHLLVCDMEYQAVSALVGVEAAREVLSGYTHYEWIYDKVLTDPRVREVVLRHGFDVSDGVPGI
jgi:hypothetical protein